MAETSKQSMDLAALSDRVPELAGMLVSIATDVVLVIDSGGVIRSVALGGSELVKAIAGDWVGRSWTDTVTRETRKKIEQLLADVALSGVSRARQVNHPSGLGQDVAVVYSAVRLGKAGPLLAVGRDLSVVSALQQRLIGAQRDMERDYWRQRHSESRYRLLFQIATDATLVVDAVSLRVLDANRAATSLFARSQEELVGDKATFGIDDSSASTVERLLASAFARGHSVEAEARLARDGGRIWVAVTPFRSESAAVLLMRARRMQGSRCIQGADLARFVDQCPDAIVLTDPGGRVSLANPAFLHLVQVPAAQEASARWLGDWIENLGEIIDKLRSGGEAGVTACTLHSSAGARVVVEMTATLIVEDGEEFLGFVLRRSDPAPAERRSPSDTSMH